MIRKRITAVLVTVCMVLGGCGNTSEEEEATAFTVNGEAVSLREWNFYVRMNQMQWEKGLKHGEMICGARQQEKRRGPHGRTD